MMWSNGGASWAGWLLMTVGMLTFLALVVIAIMALLPGVDDNRENHRERPEPLHVLDEQFALGEIDLEDYQARRAMLSKQR